MSETFSNNESKKKNIYIGIRAVRRNSSFLIQKILRSEMHMQRGLATLGVVIDHKRYVYDLFLSGFDAYVSSIESLPCGVSNSVVIVILIEVVIIALQFPRARYQYANLFEIDTFSYLKRKKITNWFKISNLIKNSIILLCNIEQELRSGCERVLDAFDELVALPHVLVDRDQEMLVAVLVQLETGLFLVDRTRRCNCNRRHQQENTISQYDHMTQCF